MLLKFKHYVDEENEKKNTEVDRGKCREWKAPCRRDDPFEWLQPHLGHRDELRKPERCQSAVGENLQIYYFIITSKLEKSDL